MRIVTETGKPIAQVAETSC
ncbi:hypothetical protein [Streptomyces sp. TRM72054]